MYDRFRLLIEERKITIYRVAKDTKIPNATLYDWKANKTVPKVDKLQKIADYLGVSLNYLLTGKE